MGPIGAGRRKPEARARGRSRPRPLWAVVLAGGDGTRLRELTHRIHGDGRPKQFATIVGSRSLLRQTLDRTARLVEPARTVVVARQDHADYLGAELRGAPPWLLAQPGNRGTAMAILLATRWVADRDPDACLAVFPSDHFVADDATLMRRVADATAFLDRHPGRIVVLAARPDDADPGYGWIEPGAVLGAAAGEPVYQVARFVEKPSPAQARAALAGGWLWNTLVVVADAGTLVEVGRLTLPEVHRHLERVRRVAGTEDETATIEHAYAHVPSTDFSRDVLQRCPPIMAALPLAAGLWSDLGTPQRVQKTLQAAHPSSGSVAAAAPAAGGEAG